MCKSKVIMTSTCLLIIYMVNQFGLVTAASDSDIPISKGDEAKFLLEYENIMRKIDLKTDLLDDKYNSIIGDQATHLQDLTTRNQNLELKVEMLQTQLEDVSALKTFNDNTETVGVKKRILVSDPQYAQIAIEQKLQYLTGQVDRHTSELQVLESNNQNLHGSTYTRWGRTTCPSINGTELVYSGYSGGSWFDHYGAAANYLCMPGDPEFISLNDVVGGFVYGVEYENVGQKHNEDAPCAVCKTKRTAIMMIPARKHCHNGWTAEYVGLLVTGHYANHASREYVCLDGAPESEIGSINNDDGGGFFNVRSKCGSLPCPPYINDGILPCVVCSR